jgi:uncharacterized Tic20 family protein
MRGIDGLAFAKFPNRITRFCPAGWMSISRKAHRESLQCLPGNQSLAVKSPTPSPSMTTQPTEIPISEIPKPERDWGLFAHLSSFIGFFIPFGNIIAPLIMWQIKKEEMPFGSSQAKECLNFQISLTIYFVVSGILCLILIGFLFLLALLVIDLIFTIMAAVKASNGIAYRYPLTIRFIK